MPLQSYSRGFVSLALRAALLLPTIGPTALSAAPNDSARLFPAETVGYLSIADAPDFRRRWRSTQLGLLTRDPAMKPFVDQLRDRLEKKVGGLKERLGASITDLTDVASGECAAAVVAIGEEKDSAAVVALIDASGRDAEAKGLIANIEKRLGELGSTRSERDGLVIHDIPADEEEEREARTVAYFYRDGKLGASDNLDLAGRLLARVGGAGGASLSDKQAYTETRDRSLKAAGDIDPTVRWFLAPFEYELAIRLKDEPEGEEELPEKKNMLALLREQGFDAVRGVGGVVAIANDQRRDFVHHTAVFAPGKPGAATEKPRDKYDLAMRMLDLPNNEPPIDAGDPPIEPWTPRRIAKYNTMHVDIENAFDHFGSLFDAFAGYEDAFETTLRAFEKDHYGPKINLRKEVIAHLGNRVVWMTDYTLPIDPECERYLFVIDVTNEEALREPLNKWLENDGAERKEVQGVPYWEIVPEDEPIDDVGLDAGLLPLDGEESDYREEREERVLRRAAVCLHNNRLVVGSDVEFLEHALFGGTPGDSLAGSADLRVALEELKKIAPGSRCGWTFNRTDESFRPTYELVREGRMPEAQTFFGRMLNRLLTTEEEREVEATREQKIDGTLLPSFELARRYFGPAARSSRSDEDGWLISGVILSKAGE